ncbi:MAG: DNA-binding NtrC family response regulator [Candidatus Paceibacteria bacterium]|jgi:DNA-binding NtrC family response regulator
MPIQRVLIVDDDPLSREYLVEAVDSLGFTVEQASSGEDALRQIANREPDLVMTDLRMPGMDGGQLVATIGRDYPDIPTVLVTAHGTVEAAVEAIRHGAEDFLLKPCSVDTIEMVIDRIDRTRRLREENEYLRSEVSGGGPSEIIGKSQQTLDLLRTAARIARSKGTVLITGESGTGKERIAQYIHQNSPRKNGPFIRVNCAALSESLLESELFGHEKGAFTGALRQHTGRFELADGGTILLDELGEISSAMQVKLLRVLEEEEFERVGGSTTLQVDVRVIATTNRDLPMEIAEGNFREDLYYRLHVLPVSIPPLRERTEDILALANYFLGVYSQRNGIEKPQLSLEAKERLTNWTWPGNVRELENVIQRSVILLESDTVEPRDLSFGPAAGVASQASTPGSGDGVGDSEEALADRLANIPVAEIERIAILATLECTGGNKTEAARRLGLTARTLSNKLKLWKSTGLLA